MEKPFYSNSSYFQCQICQTYCLTSLCAKEHQEVHRNPLREEEKSSLRKVWIPFCYIPLTRFDQIDIERVKLVVEQKPPIKSTETEDNQNIRINSNGDSHDDTPSNSKDSHSKRTRIRKRPADFVQEYTFSCHLCPGRFPCEKFLESHVKNVHNGRRSLMPCCVCGRVFNKRDSLNGHHLSHLQAEAKEVKYKLFEPWSPTLHKTVKRNANHKTWNGAQVCKVCLLPHYTHHSYLQHFLREHSNSNPPENFRFKCRSKECGEPTLEFPTIEELTNHCKDKHPLEYYGTMACSKRALQKSKSTPTDLMCTFCAYPSKNPTDLKNHIEKSHPRRFKCHHCPITFVTERKLCEHVLEVHEQKMEKNFKCEFCKKAFFNEKALRKHLILTHEKNGERKMVECYICKRKFSGGSIYGHLKRHEHKEKVRRGEKVPRYPCRLCHRDYATSATLKLHVDTMHFMKRPGNSQIEVGNTILGI